MFVRSHIIADAFNRELKGDFDDPPRVISTDPSKYPKRLPGGLYDEELICGGCEKSLWEWDDYGIDFFIRRFPTEGIPTFYEATGEVMGYEYRSVDYRRLKLFALSLLWRASATSIEFFKQTSVGPHEERLRQMVRSGDPGEPNEFSVFVTRWVAKPARDGLAKAHYSPTKAKLAGINVVKISLAGAMIYVKVDKRSLPASFEEFVLRPGYPMYAIAVELEGSNHLRSFKPALDGLVTRLARRKRPGPRTAGQ